MIPTGAAIPDRASGLAAPIAAHRQPWGWGVPRGSGPSWGGGWGKPRMHGPPGPPAILGKIERFDPPKGGVLPFGFRLTSPRFLASGPGKPGRIGCYLSVASDPSGTGARMIRIIRAYPENPGPPITTAAQR